MIYTVTLNPSIDYVMTLTDLKEGLVNRADSSIKFPGGKGINVSRILNENDIDNCALGFLGGFTGEFVLEELHKLNIKEQFVKIQDDTRINVKLHANTETEINAKGPQISENELNQFIDQFNKIGHGDTVIFSGSVPANLPQNLYHNLIEIIKKNGAEFAVDTTGQGLLDTLNDHPLVVKPNNHELADLFHTELKDDNQIIEYGKKLIQMGAQSVMISMASKGGILITQNAVFKSEAPKGTVKNSVGAGDSMLSGFVGELSKSGDFKEAFHRGLASGSATAFSLDIAKKELIDQVYKEIKITEL
ncbi:1-phosphofructokinase [Pediococcus argentinicus]|uniref:1-phosphofructokinase n=1 Tax=Pediococcus argentinicus TaxID=480391 RepID=UPI00338DBBF0